MISGSVLFLCTDESKGAWQGRTAGGCFNNATWRWNQQIFVKSEEAKKAKVKLFQTGNV